jgi:hypothetical protein
MPVQVAVTLLLVVRLFAHQRLAASFAPYAIVLDGPVSSPFVLMALFAWSIINAAVNERSIVRLD